MYIAFQQSPPAQSHQTRLLKLADGQAHLCAGIELLQIQITGVKGVLALAHVHFWTTRGETKTSKREEEYRLFVAGSGLTLVALGHPLRWALLHRDRFLPVRVPDFPAFPFTLVVSRPGEGRKVRYLLSNEPVSSVEDAWRIILAYIRRWQVELSIRYSKSDLAFESPRLLVWKHRANLMALATLVQAFLFSLLDDLLHPLREWLFNHWCH